MIVTNGTQQQSNMIDIIFFMCITDIFWNIFLLLNWMPLTLQSFGFQHIPFWTNIPCTILGIYAQLFIVQSPLWHLILAYNLGYLLLKGTLSSLNKLQRQRWYQYLFVMIIPIIFAILPIFFTKYGIYENNNSFDKECWIESEEWQLISICMILLSLIFHYIILLLLWCKYSKFKKEINDYNSSLSKYNNNNSNDRSSSLIRLNNDPYSYNMQYKSVISRLGRFVFVYTLIRVLPAIERIYECFTPNSPPFWLLVGHHISIAMVGIANFIAWNINQMDPITNWSSKTDKRISKLLDDIDENQYTLSLNSTKHKYRKPTLTTPQNNDISHNSSVTSLYDHDENNTLTTTTATNSVLGSQFIWNSQTAK